jgi:hypothetical protein
LRLFLLKKAMATPNPEVLLLYRKSLKACQRMYRERMSGYAIRLPMLVTRRRFEEFRHEKDPIVVAELIKLTRDIILDVPDRPIIRKKAIFE